MNHLLQNQTENEDEKTEQIEIVLILEAIYQKYGYDFRNYAYSSIRRRLWYRAQIEEMNTISEFQSKLLREPALMKVLLKDFSINVTEMFRDPGFFKVFRSKVVPVLRELPYIRIWHAGCSSGEEAYSMAILLHEEGIYEKTQIYATDMDEDILERAKSGKISLDHMKQYTKNYQQAGGTKEFSEYYTVKDNYVTLNPFLKKNIIFAHHNLVTDHSFNEFQVIICRNVLIYFNKQLTNRVYDLFYDSLSDNGYLGLGSKESINLYNSSNTYQEIDLVERIYKKIK